MKLCKDIKDLILTDYIDGQVDSVIKKQVDQHLNQCASCQAFAREVKTNLVVPFEKATIQPVPSHLWEQIKEKIVIGTYTQKEFVPGVNLIEGFRYWLESITFPRLMPIVCTLVMVFFVGSMVSFNQQTKQAQNKEQVLYLAAILNSAGTMGQTGAKSFGTPIEAYFL